MGVFGFCKINSVSSPSYSPRDNFSPESEGSVNPKIEVQSREEITVGWNVHHLALTADSLISLIHLEMQRKVFILLLPSPLPPPTTIN